MMEKEIYFAWYRLRGIGLVCLCSFVFFFGAYLANQRSMAVNGTVDVGLQPVSHIQREDRKVALSFDLANGCESVRTILSILEKHQTKATFFVTENWAELHQEEIKDIAAAGHDLGSRGTDRQSMVGKTETEIKAEIRKAHDRVQDLTGVSMNLFRAPYGEYDPVLLNAVREAGYLPIGWDIDSEDWKDYGVESILKKVTENEKLSGGSIVRMHGGAEYTPQALETVITGLQEKGYEPVSVSQLLF